MWVTVIEKHFTLSRAGGSVDSIFSMEPEELKAFVVRQNVHGKE
ncbi:N-acetylneuraminate synthase family protein [Viridibacillus sp. YIM B01967]|uniref:N-acetylneuraminate synthase family protein n=1 Tax=Viridibacillus soli TaxID=2798301 RepID=A0ABS1H6C2_9BACL|nr:N-acetylneuraminate synthase family protein [Viridibacillus soli]